MSVRIFVGNLSFDVTESDLRDLFSKAGVVTQIRIPLDRESGRPRGFAFIDFEERGQAVEAMRTMDQQMFKGRPLVVNEAKAREEGSRGPSRGPSRGAAPAFRRGDGPPPPEKARRNFGADAVPKKHRKAEQWASKGPKGPIREFGGVFSDDDGLEPDEKPFWEMAEMPDSADSEDGGT